MKGKFDKLDIYLGQIIKLKPFNITLQYVSNISTAVKLVYGTKHTCVCGQCCKYTCIHLMCA